MTLDSLVEFILSYLLAHPSADKEQLAAAVAARFALTKMRKLFVGADFSVRFCRTSTEGVFSGGVISIAAVVHHDDKPFVVCLRTPSGCKFMLANTTFVARVSHSSQLLAEDRLRGSINGSDILRQHRGVANEPANFDRLWKAHLASDKAANLARIVAATRAIQATAQAWTASAAGEGVPAGRVGPAVCRPEDCSLVPQAICKNVRLF
jgi:hypothetical protein